MAYFGLKLGQDLGNRAGHLYQEFRGVPRNIFRSPSTLLRLRMPYFLVLISHVRTSQAYAYACAYRTSGNQAFKSSFKDIQIAV